VPGADQAAVPQEPGVAASEVAQSAVLTSQQGTTDATATRDPAPGTRKRKRGRLKIYYELVGCGLHGHYLVGRDAASVGPGDAELVRDRGSVRWHRCLRCDSWLGLEPPTQPKRDRVPSRDEIEVPLRGKPLRDRFVLRLIAIDRVFHFVILSAFGIAIVLFAHDKARLKGEYTKILNAIQGAAGGPLFDTRHNSFLHEINHLFTLSTSKLYLIGFGVLVYASVQAIEAVGLWYSKRWAEYLTVLELAVLLPIEIRELLIRVTPLKLITLAVNILIIVYLVVAHKLFGIRGGAKAHHAEVERDTGWNAVERHTPDILGTPTAEQPPGGQVAVAPV
jgi:uncharacterized membrane protein (DUF2068 family)